MDATEKFIVGSVLLLMIVLNLLEPLAQGEKVQVKSEAVEYCLHSAENGKEVWFACE